MKKLKLLMAALALLLGWSNAWAVVTDYLNAGNGWSKVTSLSGISTSGTDVYVIATQYENIVVGIPDEGSDAQISYQTLSGQPIRQMVWLIEDDTYGTGGYALKNLARSGYYLTAYYSDGDKKAWNLVARASAKNTEYTCYQFDFDGSGNLSIQTNNAVDTDAGRYWGDWTIGSHGNGDGLAGNKQDANKVTFALYKKSLTTNGNDITFLIGNPSFELNTFNGTQDPSSSIADGGGTINKPTGFTCYYNVEGWRDCISNKTNPADGTYCMNSWFGVIREQKFYQTIDYLPEGVYEISAQVRTDQTSTDGIYTYGIAGGETYKSASWDASKMAGTWNSMENWQTLTARAFVIGGGSLQLGVRSDKFFQFDDFHLTSLGTDLLLDELKSSFSTKQTTANSLLGNSDYDNVTGTERTTLTAKKGVTPEESVAGWTTAVNELQDAIDAFTAAKTSYDQYTEAAAIASTIAATSVTAPTTSAEALARAHELYVNIDTKVTATYTYDATGIYSGSFGGTFTSTTSGQHWSGDGGKSYYDNYDSGNISATQTFTLPAGSYVIKVAGRASSAALDHKIYVSANGTTVTFPNNGDTGYGITKTGLVKYDAADDTYCNSNNGRGWEWRFIPLSLAEETDVTVTVSFDRSASTWGSFSDFTILMSSAEDADADDYAALNAAIAAAEAKTLGFEDGEYAPYNNVDVLATLAAAKDINQEVANPKSVVNSATTILSTAWTANDGEVNAFSNSGNFNTTKGWKNSGWIDTAYGAVCVLNGNNITYGETASYTMPLKANTYYELSFRHAGWDSSNEDNGGTVSVLRSGEGLVATSYGGNTGHYKDNDAGYKNEKFVFKTGATAGDYILTLTGNSGRTTVKGFNLVKAPDQSVTVSSAGYATLNSATL